MAADNQEVGEKPVREQLQKARIGNNSDEAGLVAAESAAAVAEASEAPRLQKKRSFEDLDDTPAREAVTTGARNHTRKRSREGTIGEEDSNGSKRKVSGERTREGSAEPPASETNGVSKALPAERSNTPDHAGEKRSEGAVEEMASPKIKRSRLHSTTGDGSSGENTTANPGTAEGKTTVSGEDAATKVPPTSGFANASSASPFTSLSENKSPPADTAQTSSSAFASSGFGALAGSTTSGFGSIGKSSGGFGAGGGFGSGSKSPPGADAKKENEKPATSSFGGALGQQSAFASAGSSGSGFGSGASSFGGKLGQSSGFASGIGGTGFSSLGGGGGLTSFASGKATPLSGAVKQAKAFGAPADDDEDGDDAETGTDSESAAKSPLAVEDDPQDERFYKQDIETGEEGETTEFSCRAKLYNWVTLPEGKKEWRERGLGVLRLNVKVPESGAEDQALKARFLMRADGSHRVVLNTPVKKEIKFGSPSGEEPKGGLMFFMGTIDGKTSVEFLQLKMKQQFALEMWEKITELQKEM